MRCTSFADCPGRAPVMRGLGRESARKYWIWWRNASSIGSIPHSQRRNQGKVQLAPGSLGCLPRQSFMPGCRWLMTISEICSRIHVRMPWQWLRMPTARCWWQLSCWRAMSRAKSLCHPCVAWQPWAVASICIVKGAQGAIGDTHWLATKNRCPQQQAALGILWKGGHPHQPYLTQKSCHIWGV